MTYSSLIRLHPPTLFGGGVRFHHVLGGHIETIAVTWPNPPYIFLELLSGLPIFVSVASAWYLAHKRCLNVLLHKFNLKQNSCHRGREFSYIAERWGDQVGDSCNCSGERWTRLKTRTRKGNGVDCCPTLWCPVLLAVFTMSNFVLITLQTKV